MITAECSRASGGGVESIVIGRGIPPPGVSMTLFGPLIRRGRWDESLTRPIFAAELSRK